MKEETSTTPEAADAPDDRELVVRAQQHDIPAYEELVRRYHGKIFSLVFNMTRNREDAEDMVQDVFTKAYTSLKSFKGTSSFYTWIYRIGVNHTLNFIKKRKKAPQISLNEPDAGAERDPTYLEIASQESPVRDTARAELQEKLNKALMTLSEKHRTVVVLHDIQGVPHDEIARITGCSEGTVRSRLFYARQRLQSELAEYAGYAP